jgi:YD repeat-containing protein
MNQSVTFLVAVSLLLISAHRLPAPIQEVPESPTPARTEKAKPKKTQSQSAVESEPRTKSARKPSATEQARSDAVRVTVSTHPDGSRTVYNFDKAQHKAVATTTDADGKLRETTRYELDDAGRFSSAEISGPDDRTRLKSRYKYDDAGRVLEETQSAPDSTLLHKIVYNYDSSGKQTGYSIFDASGKLVSRTSAAAARPSPSPKPRQKNRQ